MTEDRTELTRAQLKQVNALAATMNETAGELLKLCTRRHPSLYQAQYLMRQANLKLCEIFHNLELVNEPKKR